MRWTIGTLALAITISVGAFGVPPTLTSAQTIPLPAVEGRIDHLAVDLELKRLYVAALGNGTVEVIDLAAGKRVDAIKGLHEPQGIAVIPKSHVIAVGVGGDGACRLYDSSLKPLGAITGLDDADNVRYDAAADRIDVGYGYGALGVIDPSGPKLVSKIQMPGHPESFRLAATDDRVYVNVPDARQVTVADRTSGAVVARWKVSEARSNFPMALDEKNRRLFIACRGPAKLLVLDMESGVTRANVDCVGDADDLFYDAEKKRVYVIGGEGKISVFNQTDADHYALVDSVATAAGARTGLFVPETHRLYVAVPHRGSQGAEIRVYDAK